MSVILPTQVIDITTTNLPMILDMDGVSSVVPDGIPYVVSDGVLDNLLNGKMPCDFSP